MRRFGYRIFLLLEKFFLYASLFFQGLAKKLRPNLNHYDAVIASTSYDMVDSPGEDYYAEQYWKILSAYLPERHAQLVIYDFGCSQGRFSMRFARHFPNSHVFACDISEKAILQAKSNAILMNISSQVHYEVKSIKQFLSAVNESIDIAAMTEVTFFYPEWVVDFSSIVSKLNHNGLLVMSFRPRYYEALSLVRARLFQNFDPLLSQHEGNIYNTNVRYSWQQSDEIRKMFESEPSLELLEICGIGACSGISGDPHDVICQPSLLSEGEKEALMKFEIELGKIHPDVGRYMLVVARKTNKNVNQNS